MDYPTYRIEVRGESNLYYRFITATLFIWLWALWLWPYYMPALVKMTIAAVVIVAFYFEFRRVKKGIRASVLSISLSGRIVIYTSGNEAGWLQAQSRVFIGFYYLRYQPELGGKKKSLVIYTDQVSDIDRRRLSRLIYAAALT